MNKNQCYVTTLTGPNRGNLCNCKVGIINGKCRTHRVQYIDVSNEFDGEYDDYGYDDDNEYDFDDGFIVHDDDDEEAEFDDDDYQPPKKRKREKMSEKMSEKMHLQPKDQPNVTAIQPKVTATPQIQPKVTATPQIQPKVTATPIQPKVTVTQPVNLNRNLLENTFATLSLFDLRAFTGIQNINLQPMHERAFIISTYFDYINAANA